ncbi:hypothetical protein D1871_11225 [Nakamurella silvestris]|nr:hypothetical protein D1871_11225 [Nakamurella silvestris]
MKRKDLLKKISQIAKDQGLAMHLEEGGSHTKVTVGTKNTVVPRHNEVNEITAKAILKQIGGPK